jgi:hypothetical protein
MMLTARGALTLLADGPSGCTEQVMRAYGFPSELVTKVVEAGFASDGKPSQRSR